MESLSYGLAEGLDVNDTASVDHSADAGGSSHIYDNVPEVNVLPEVAKRKARRLLRHADLWLPDGSVVLRADSTLFCVHMSQLSRHSVVFRDMFSMPQPLASGLHPLRREGSQTSMRSRRSYSEAKSSPRAPSLRSLKEEKALRRFDPSVEDAEDDTMCDELDGRPVISLQDSPEDVENLLKALYDGPNFGNNDPSDFHVVSGVLRLSTKYVVDSLRAKALTHLGQAWPTTLKGWDAREDMARSALGDVDENGVERQRFPSPIAVINLALEVNAPSLLPSAFYDLSRHLYSAIYDPHPTDTPSSPLHPSPAHPLTLSPQDMARLAIGKEAAQHAIVRMISALGNPHASALNSVWAAPGPSPPASGSHYGHQSWGSGGGSRPRGGCTSTSACRNDFSELVSLATQHYLFERERGCLDPLYVAEELAQLKSAEFGECVSCARALEGWAGRERERVWRSIVGWFRLV